MAEEAKDRPADAAGLDLAPRHLEMVLDILKRRVPDREVWAFGSRVTGRARRYSDLDLAVIGEERLPLRLEADLKDDFEESDLPIRVDVVDWAAASPEFQEIVAARKIVLQSPL